MRKISAFLAILVAFSGALGVDFDFSWASVAASCLFSGALAAGAVFAFRGGDLIYLSTAWGLYLGMNLPIFAAVISAFGMERSRTAGFGITLLVLLLMMAVVGLFMTFAARRKEQLA